MGIINQRGHLQKGMWIVDPMKEGEINTQKMFFKPKICAANISTEKPHVYRLWCNLNTLFDIRLLIRIYKLEEG